MSENQNLPIPPSGSFEIDSTSPDPSTVPKPILQISKPSGIRPPTVIGITSVPNVSSSTPTPTPTPNSDGPPPHFTRIGRPCCAHGTPKAGPPPHDHNKHNMRRQSDDHSRSHLADNMRRQSDDHSRSHLADVNEENEADFVFDDKHNRATKSKSPDSGVSSSKPPKYDRKISNGSDLYWEATGRRRSSDHGIVLTTDTDSFIIGQRVWVGGLRPGQIAFIGDTHFAAGEWAGIVLDEPTGKNDGCVAGKRYFQCEPKRGIFSKLTRLTREPLPGASSGDLTFNQSLRSVTSPSRSGTVSPTHSVKSSMSRATTKNNMGLGDRVIVSSGLGSRPGVLKFLGETKFAAGNWCGVQLDEPTGKNDGTVDGFKYFECPQNYGIFVPLAKVTLSPSARKPRLSRTGSKESLTSVGTMGSIASTATSRLRLSAQRLSHSARPISTPKNTYSLQDVLREKQNHIEQLLKERDLDRQDAEHQTMIHQKMVNQLQDKVQTLEKQLHDEKQKSEDLQLSIDEATFCGDELNAQTQDYKEKIIKLEKQLTASVGGEGANDLFSNDGETTTFEIDEIKATLTERNFKIEQLETELARITKENLQLQIDSKESVVASQKDEQRLREQIDYLSTENGNLKAELCAKDEATEKEYLNMKHIENELKEELENVHRKLLDQETALASNDLKKALAEKDEIISKQRAEILSLSNELVRIRKEYEEEIDKIKNSTSEQTKKFEQLLLDTKSLNDKSNDQVTELKMRIEQREQEIEKLEKELKQSKEEVNSTKSSLSQQEKLLRLHSDEIKQLETLMVQVQATIYKLMADLTERIRISLSDRNEQIDHMKGRLRSLTDKFVEIKSSKETLKNNLLSKEQQIEDNELLIDQLQTELKSVNKSNGLLKIELETFQQNIGSQDEVNVKLNEELKTLQENLLSKTEEIETVKKSLDEQVKMSQQLLHKLDTVTQTNVSLSDDNLKSLSNLTDVKEKLIVAELKNQQNVDELENLTKEVVELKTTINTKTTEVNTLHDSLNERDKNLSALTDDIQQRKRDIEECHNRINDLENDNNRKEIEIDKHQKQIDDLLSKLRSGDEKTGILQTTLSALEVEHGDLGRKFEILEQKHNELNEEKETIQISLAALRNTSTDTNDEVRRLTDELSNRRRIHQEQLDEVNNTKLSLERQLHELNQNVEGKLNEIVQLNGRITEIQQKKIEMEEDLTNELEKTKEMLNEEKDRSTKELESLKSAYETEKSDLLRNINEKLTESEGVKQQLSDSITRLEENIHNLQSELNNSRVEFTTKETEFGVKINQLNEIEASLRTDLKRAEDIENQLKQSLQGSEKTVSDQITNLNQIINDKISKITESEEKLQQLEATNTDLKSTVEKLRKENEIDKINQESLIDSLKIERDGAVDKIQSLKEEHQSLTGKWKEMEDEQVDLVNKNLELLKQITAHNETMVKINEENAALKKNIEELSNKYQELEIGSQKLVSQNDDSNKIFNEQLINEKKLSETYLENSKMFEQKCIDLTNDLERVKSINETTIKDYEQRLNTANASIKDYQLNIEALEKQINNLTSSVNLSDDLKNELANKSQALQAKELNIAQLSDSVQTLERQIDAKNNEFVQLTTEKSNETNRLLSEIDEKNQTIEESLRNQIHLETELSSLKLQFDQIVNEKESLSKEISSLNDNLNRITESQSESLKQSAETEESVIAIQKQCDIKLNEQQTEIISLKENVKQLEKQLKEKSKNLNDFLTKEKELELKETHLQLEERKMHTKLEQAEQMHKKEIQLMNAQQRIDPPKVMPLGPVVEGETGAQISFLNSIIADMHKKNETLLLRIQALESEPFKSGSNPFDIPIRREPAPRLFCDICDVFDGHDTEDCPIQQSSDSPPLTTVHGNDVMEKKRVIPPPRKYCQQCESFGHEASECTNDETF